ncbi:MAG TPA: hypothetical protein VFW47_08340 [Phenylobacterium sp.]|nr:hypothetical protein [Phenylobacterium sp.]
MAPDELRKLNIERFRGLLVSETDPQRRSTIEALLAEEQQKTDSAYPIDTPRGHDRPSL